MRLLFDVLSMFIFAARRLWHNLGLMIGTAIGLIVAVALVMSVPLYADGVNYRLMARALAEKQDDARRPPYAFMFRYIGSWYGAVEWQAYAAADSFFATDCPAIIGLPVEQAVRYVKTDDLRVFPAGLSAYSDSRQMLDRLAVGFVGDLAGHIRLVEGRMPAAQAVDSSGALEVLVSEAKANEFGISAGENFVLFGEGNDPASTLGQLPVKVVGIWRARSLDDAFWFYEPSAFDGVFLTVEESFVSRVTTMARKPVYLALWYIIFDGRGVHTGDVPDFLGRVNVVESAADRTLAKTSLDISPVDALFTYVEQTRLLTILLFVFSVPIIGLVLYFMMLTTNLVLQRQRNEIAVLRSRGTSVVQIVFVYLIEGLLLGALAMAIGPLAGQAIAYAMGAARSFLLFDATSALTITLSQQSVQFGLVAVVAALISTLLPAMGAAQHTIVTYKQDVARTLARPWWQRLYLDWLLLAVPLYGYYLLAQRGTISFLGRTVQAAEGDPFRNPLLFLVPTLFVFALALLFIRVFPPLMALLARLFGLLHFASPLLALRQLARSWGFYTGPLLLIVLTMGLACFTASMARTLDVALVDQTYYDVGADLRLTELGETSDEAVAAPGPANSGETSATGVQAQPQVFWYFLPVAEHLKAPTVQAAARLGRYPLRVSLGSGQAYGKMLGIDRLDYLRMAYFRRDFAPDSLGALINQLARDESGVLVTRDFLAQFGLRVGDTFVAELQRGMPWLAMPFTIVGVLELWPTTYPSAGTVMVASLDYIFEQMGGPFPYDVLLNVQPGTDTPSLVTELNDLGLRVLAVEDSQALIRKERERPERQGILGLLSVGALTASFLTVLGLSFYSFVSFRRRFIELGILRAIGLSVPQMVMALGLEQLVLIAAGVGAGTGFGVVASHMFIPFLQVRAGANAQIPPYVVQIAWADILKVHAIFGAMLLFTVIGLAWLLTRMRIAEAVKLGESV